MTTRHEFAAADWPADIAIAPERIISGSPVASTLETAKTEKGETGLWRCTPGEFTTQHEGFVEFIHIIEGEGDLIHDDGTVLPLAPGTTITMDDGWSGRWDIRQTLVKAYGILTSD
ncbi:cupin domain-containing protein [Mycobacterium sp. 141]|uniref:cupin domain-containing protein n=1 Tax=Mycobacterium sp. 141 TaxID=1120797 RepID=UPI00036526AF|nr:cupin domain-containing protein [Mycobacterium sp. 141]